VVKKLQDAKFVFRAFYWLFLPPIFLIGIFAARHSVGSYPGDSGVTYLGDIFLVGMFFCNVIQTALLLYGLYLNRSQRVLSSDDHLLLIPAIVVVFGVGIFQFLFFFVWRS
jgi:ABC-type dipeptide/oligopeptide/nickel transport system permease subunit